MTEADQAEFVAVLNGVAAMKKTKLDTMVIELWWRCMADWELEDFRSAAAHLLKNLTWMPSPSDFEKLRKAGRPTVGEAWNRAVGHAASSAYRRGPTGDAIVDQCARMIGGYPAIAMCDESNLHYLERRFAEHYAALEDREDIREAIPEIAYQADRKLIAGTFCKPS